MFLSIGFTQDTWIQRCTFPHNNIVCHLNSVPVIAHISVASRRYVHIITLS